MFFRMINLHTSQIHRVSVYLQKKNIFKFHIYFYKFKLDMRSNTGNAVSESDYLIKKNIFLGKNIFFN